MFAFVRLDRRGTPSRRHVAGVAPVLWAAWGAALAVAADPQADTLVLLDGTRTHGVVTAISTQGEISAEGWDQPVKLDALRFLERPVAAGKIPAEVPDVIVELAGGGRLQAAAVSLADETFRIRWRYGNDATLPIDAVRAVRLRPAESSEEFDEALAGPADAADRLFLDTDGLETIVRGYLLELDDQQAVVEVDDRRRAIPRAQLFGAVMAVVGRPRAGESRCRVDLQNGSWLVGRVESLTPPEPSAEVPLDPLLMMGGALKFAVGEKASLSVPWAEVRRLTVFSHRLVYVSDLDPIEVAEQPLVTFPRPWQRDRSVDGRTLTVGGRTYAKGIGVKPRSALTFALDSEFELLTATVGIDDEAAGRGQCEFVVLGDGRELFRQDVSASGGPKDVRIEVRGVKRLTLLVEPGRNLDLGDHADWCDLCLIRPAE